MELLVFPTRERLMPVKECCWMIDLGLAYIFLLYVFIPTHIPPDKFETSAVNSDLEVAKAFATAFVVGLPSAPLRFITSIPSACWASLALLRDMILGVCICSSSIHRRVFPDFWAVYSSSSTYQRWAESTV